ncbi:hypothetical protein [Falsiroseomonas sp. HW251]|uniref:hypothetical protein n=1 Tax=Falsiroseomonas sp. HW251 TaxID=3390998 RepID=UPI003D317234
MKSVGGAKAALRMVGGPSTMLPIEDISSVVPSGLVRAVEREAIMVLAPGRWSLTKVPPSRACSACVIA